MEFFYAQLLIFPIKEVKIIVFILWVCFIPIFYYLKNNSCSCFLAEKYVNIMLKLIFFGINSQSLDKAKFHEILHIKNFHYLS